MESSDGDIAGDEWKTYARESDQVWYVRHECSRPDRCQLRHRTGLLTDHHLVTRLTNNNGNFSFAAQVRLDFDATDSDGNKVWSGEGISFRLDQLLAGTPGADRESSLTKITTADAQASAETALLSSLLPSEGDFLVILVDALGGNDVDHRWATVQKTVVDRCRRW